jgi:hypothetical protein
MDEKSWTERSFKWLGGHDITITKEFLNRDYSDPVVEPGAAPKTSTTGLLVLFRIEPKSGRSYLPSFSARWDHGPNTVDIDLVGDPGEERKFKSSKPGYRGHRTTKVTDDPRVYAIDVETPATGHVFKGTIALNVDLGFELSGSLTMSADVHVKSEVVRNPSWAPVAAVLAAISCLSLVFVALHRRKKK